MAENHAPWLSTAMAMLLPWSTMTFGVRVWTKTRSKNWDLDDYFLSAAVVTGIVHIGVTCLAIHHGYGKSMSEISEPDFAQMNQALYAGQILYNLSTGLCKISAALFVAHMTYFGPQSRPAYAFAGLSTFWTLASMLVIALRTDLSRPWDTMDGTDAMYCRWILTESTGLFLELGLWILSVNLVWGLQMRKQKRCFILGAFGARLGMIPIVAYRLVYLSPAENADPTLDAIIAGILTQGAIHFSIISGNVTCLKPFFRTFNPACAVESRGKAASNCSATRDSYYKLDTLKRREQTLVDTDDSANWRPFQGLGEGRVVSQPPRPLVRTRDRSSPPRHAHRDSKGAASTTEAEGAERLVIQRTTEVSVKYEHHL